MCNSNSFGDKIATLRKQAGYSQKQLADALNITDKAVSKWERGLSCPDISLLPKLSALLDSDIEPLIEGVSTINTSSWKGILDISKIEININSVIYDKPMVYYLLSYFMLVGITDILIVCREDQQQYLDNLYCWNDVGLNLLFSDKYTEDFINDSNIMLFFNSVFLFTASLTRQLQAFMSSTDLITRVFSSDNKELPVFFIKRDVHKKIEIKYIENEKYSCRILGRGTLSININNNDDLLDASSFVKMFQNHHNHKIADLKEIANNRKLI